MSAISPPIRLAGSNLQEPAHICAFFKSSEEAHRPFVKEGLDLGQKALHTIDPSRRDEHTCWLNSAGIDPGATNNQVEILDWTESHLRNGEFDQQWTLAFWQKEAEDDAAKEGFPVRFVSQMEWVLQGGLSSEDLPEVMRTHPLVLVGGVLQENPFFVLPEKFLTELRKKRTRSS